MATSVQRHGGYDGPLVACSTTVPVLHSTLAGQRSWRVRSSPCRQCTRQDCPPAVEVTECADQPFESESTGSSEDVDLIPIHSGETGLHCLMTICHNRLLLRVIHFAYPHYRRKIRSASHYHRGFCREFFQSGRWSEACVRSYDCCGIIVLTLQGTAMGSSGVGGAHRGLCCSY